MALLQNKPCQFYGRQKIYLQTKFELSRLTLAPFRPIFSFQSLNKLCPLVAYPKIGLTVCAHMGQDQSTQVWLSSDNFKDNFSHALCRTAHNHIRSCILLSYVVRSPTLKRKSECPSGINKVKNKIHSNYT